MTGPVVAESVQNTDINGGATDNLSITFGTAPAAGQLIVIVAVSPGGETLTAPSGFTTLFGDASSYGVYAKVASGSEGTTLTMGYFNTAGIMFGLRITGAATSSPVDASGQNTGNNASPAVTTTQANDLLFSIAINPSTNVVGTQPSGMTLLQTANVGEAHGGPISAAIASETQATAGTSLALPWSQSESFAITIAISPAVASSKLLLGRRRKNNAAI